MAGAAMRSASPNRRSAAVAADRAAAKAERDAVKALKTDLQAVVYGLTGASTLADVRQATKDLARISKRIVAATVG